MDINKMRNIVILRDLPSNLIDEAFVVLKENQKIKKFEFAENKNDKFSKSEKEDGKENDQIVVKEAELLVSNYINNLENENLNSQNEPKDLQKKYKYSKMCSLILGFALFVMCTYILFIN